MGGNMPYNFLASESNISRHWNKRVVRTKEGVNISKANLPSTRDLIEAFSGNFNDGSWTKRLPVNINASKVNSEGIPNQLLSIDIDTARECYSNGFSICFGDLSVVIDPITELKRTAARVFDYPELVLVTGYLSPPNVSGLLHYDRQHNFFIQREGVKRWYVSELPAIENPHENLIYSRADTGFFEAMRARGYEIALPRDCGQQVYDLYPGDVLYVPPGYYHSPETLDAHSLHYTLTIEPACFWKDLNQQLFSLLLANNSEFFEDHRFLSKAEKSRLYSRCKDQIIRELAGDR
jgi:hypothetical protein